VRVLVADHLRVEELIEGLAAPEVSH